MKFLSFRSNKIPVSSPAAAVSPAPRSDCNKTELIAALLQMPPDLRNACWKKTFLGNVAGASFECGDPHIMIGPNGFPFFVLQTPATSIPYESICIDDLSNFLLEKGLGIAINPNERLTEWVFSYGDILNLRLNNTFLVETPQAETTHVDFSDKVEFEKSDRDILLAQPSAAYLPLQARRALKRFLQTKGQQKPMILLRCRKKAGRVAEELVFNIYLSEFASGAAMQQRMQEIAWFLPAHYTVGCYHQNFFPARHFAQL